MAITPFTVYPQSSDPEDVFSYKGDVWIKELSTQFIPDANELASEINDNAVLATEQATIATTQAGIATTQANLAAAQVDLAADQVTLAAIQVGIAASIANYKGPWSSLSGALNFPASAYHINENWQLLENVADVTAHEPGISDKWAIIQKQITMAKAFYLWSM